MNPNVVVPSVHSFFRIRLPLLAAPIAVLLLMSSVECGGGGSPSTKGGPQSPVYAGQGTPFAADFNGDGKPDVLTAYGSNVTMNLGRGDGTFDNAISVAIPSGFVLADVGDFNGDHIPDLLVVGSCIDPACSNPRPLTVLLGKGDGTFRTTSTSTTAALPSLVVGDLNGDGKADIAGVFNASVFVYLSNGDGTFSLSASYNVGATSYALGLGDFNGDGKPDIVASMNGDNNNLGQEIVLLGNGDGTFQQAVMSTGGYISSGDVVEDFNADGKQDLAVSGCDIFAGCVEWILLGNGDGTFQMPIFLGNATDPLDGAHAVAGGDFDRDGRGDLAVQTDPFIWEVADIYLGGADGTFPSPTQYHLGLYHSPDPNSRGVAVADFDGDGKLDIAVANLVLLGNGDGTFLVPPR